MHSGLHGKNTKLLAFNVHKGKGRQERTELLQLTADGHYRNRGHINEQNADGGGNRVAQAGVFSQKQLAHKAQGQTAHGKEQRRDQKCAGIKAGGNQLVNKIIHRAPP